ncbi:S8 family peptidase [Candidatus Altiarchaeota archaeon]
MKRLFILGLVLALLSAHASAAGAKTGKVRILMSFKGEPDTAVISNAGGNVLHRYGIIKNRVAVEIPANALKGILNNPNVEGFEYDALAYANKATKPCEPWPSCRDDPEPPEPDPEQELPWGVDRVDADLVAGTGAGVVVCIVDTGIDKDHPDLEANIIGGRNFVKKRNKLDTNAWDDDAGHGSHVAGTVAAIDNEIGVVGVAPQASLLGAKVLNSRGVGYITDIMAGVDYCVAAGADVISMSLGSGTDVQGLHDAVDAAEAAGVVVVASAGNSAGPVVFPAAYSSVIAISATDSSDNIASFSSFGPEVELSAPGVNVLSTWMNGGYDTKSGTSMSAPHVSGVAALAIQANPGLDNDEIRTLLHGTADDLGALGHDDYFGYGLVDAQLA